MSMDAGFRLQFEDVASLKMRDGGGLCSGGQSRAKFAPSPIRIQDGQVTIWTQELVC
jgi:hypothetical protein